MMLKALSARLTTGEPGQLVAYARRAPWVPRKLGSNLTHKQVGPRTEACSVWQRVSDEVDVLPGDSEPRDESSRRIVSAYGAVPQSGL